LAELYDEDDVILNPELAERPLDVDSEEAQPVTIYIRRRLPGRRLDKYLHARFPRLSRTLIQRLIKQGDITVNGRPTKASYEPDGHDRVELVIPPPEPYDLLPEAIPLDIIYEDDHLLAINKQKGIIVHPSRVTQTGTLANGLAYTDELIRRGGDVEKFARRLSFFFYVHMDFFEEVAKFRAARRLWARIMRERYGVTDPRAQLFRFGVLPYPPGAIDYLKYPITLSGERFVEATNFRPLFGLEEIFHSLRR